MRNCILRGVVALGALIPAVATAQEGCKAAEATKLPAVSALLDSATLVKNLPAPDASASKEVLVSVTTGPAPKAVVLDTVVAKSDAAKLLTQKVLASLRPNAKDVAAAFRLRVLLGEAPTLAVLPPIVCPPTSDDARRLP
jgi:hypothetical protein